MAAVSFKSSGQSLNDARQAQSAVTPNPIGFVTPMRLSTTQKDIFEMHYNHNENICNYPLYIHNILILNT